MKLAQTWERISAPVSEAAWEAVDIQEKARLARTSGGGVALLVPAEPVACERYGLATEHISYSPSLALEVELNDGTRIDGDFSVLQCSAGEPVLVRQFLRIVESCLPSESLQHWETFDQTVRSVFELFRHLTSPGSRTAQGLWAELLLIAYADDPALMVRAFHSDPNELHDFFADGTSLEVKSTTGALREHHFSLEQLEQGKDQLVVASLLLQEDVLGTTINELVAKASARIGEPELRRRLESIVVLSLGSAWLAADQLRFGERAALETLRLFAAKDIPSLAQPIPTDIHHVRYVASLAGTAPIRAEDPMAPLIATVFPLSG
ncbi:MAG: PD-(D/E)XK motif protein [Myxococcota bacterium]